MATATFITAQDGLVLYLEYMTNKIDNVDLEVRLFTNDATIDEDTVLGDLTEATNYTLQTLDSTNFTVAYNVTNTRAEAVYGAVITLPFTGSATIYGAYLTTTGGARLVSVSKFAVSQTVADGEYVRFNTLTLSLDN